MTPLQPKFRQRGGSGFDSSLMLRQGDVALLSKSKDMEACHGRFTTFEVVIIQKLKEYEIAGAKIEAHEALPSSEKWGVAGWSFQSQESARKHFNPLAAKLFPNEPLRAWKDGKEISETKNTK